MGDSGMVRPLSAIGCRLSAIRYRLSAAKTIQPRLRRDGTPPFGACGTTFPPLKRGENKRGEKTFYTTRRRQAAITYGEAVPLFYCGGAAATTLGAKGAVKPKNPTAVGRSNLRTFSTTFSLTTLLHNPPPAGGPNLRRQLRPFFIAAKLPPQPSASKGRCQT